MEKCDHEVVFKYTDFVKVLKLEKKLSHNDHWWHVDGTGHHYYIIEQVETCRKKACLEGLKCLNKKFVVALSIELLL